MLENNLKQFEKNVKSQFGEDGVILEIFNRIGHGSKFCVEFGAWDGEYLSNSYNLFFNLGWHAMLIESDAERCVLMEQKFKHDNNIILNRFVKATGPDSLDQIIKQQNITERIDLLSIDIDGDDYYILEGLKDIKPRVIVIEYNPTIPPGFELKQSPGQYFGSSCSTILKLGQEKGYELAHVTETNVFLVDATEFHKLNILPQDLSDFRFEKNYSYLVSSYDGKPFLLGQPVYGKENFYTKLNFFQKFLFNCFIRKRISNKKPESSNVDINNVLNF